MSTAHTPIRLFVKCDALPALTNFSKSNPHAILYDLTGGTPRLVGRTETIPECLSPEFKAGHTVAFFFERRQDFRVEVRHKAGTGGDALLGSADFTLGSVVASTGHTLTMPLGTGAATATATASATVTITAAVDGGQKGLVSLTLRGKSLTKMDTFGKTDGYVIIRRVLGPGQHVDVYHSEVVPKSLNPQWKATRSIDLQELCGGDMLAPCIQIACFDEDPASDEPMGAALVSGESLLSGGSQEFELVAEEKGRRTSFGFICLDECQFTPLPSFTECLRSGLQVNVAFSIDFTGSNGAVGNPNSLHFFNPTHLNNYIRAMLAVSNVVQEYDSDKFFPAFGFGAAAPFTNGTSHFFPLNGNPSNAYLPGMQAVINTYAGLLPVLQLSGPTNFAPTIRALSEGARQAKNTYTILMILTDGAVTDTTATADAIVAADDAPLSIVIVGIGSGDFSSFFKLDGDAEPLKNSAGRATRRDLVQFVAMSDFEGKDPALLAANLLMEVPWQVEQWARIAQNLS